jgi:hypothetical protein
MVKIKKYLLFILPLKEPSKAHFFINTTVRVKYPGTETPRENNTYPATFKLVTVQSYEKGQTPMEIFLVRDWAYLSPTARNQALSEPLGLSLCPSWRVLAT